MPGFDPVEIGLLILADAADVARAAGIEHAAGRRVGTTRYLAREPDAGAPRQPREAATTTAPRYRDAVACREPELCRPGRPVGDRSKAPPYVIVHDADVLHEGIGARRAHESVALRL